ncbi:adenylosuccinate lyase family protein [Streptomyces sp. C11-1]|uniref:Adenylosuccinate lyase family protein n=1 Tax=Streptomyces durocortorensis TaxID=2811104 RepID=A0ABY9VN75_9ACTN|nr:adenylosuccinate lyase family protein [Streptomyces durocortorensis]WNF25385.1 adenylosuccinate lyase family protein [Streptomyces durocortorensis]
MNATTPPAHAADTIDAGLLSPVRAGTPAEAATSDGAWLQALLDAEAALVRAQAGLGNVPGAAAEAITELARAERLDLREIAVLSRGAANPVVAVVQAFTALVAAKAPDAADYVHRGSTSQDIFDTALMLVAGRTLDFLAADLDGIAASLRTLADEHRQTLMAGRTLALHAVPTTFGLKAAGWLAAVCDTRERLRRLRSDGLVVQLGGAAGTLAGYVEYERLHREARQETAAEGYAARLAERFAAETGLSAPALPWHSHRAPIAALGAELALATGVLGKIAVDVQSLARTETAELAEPAAAGRGVSSAMPQKRNPALATLIRSAALQVPAYAGVLAQTMLSEDERSAGAWHAEWQPLRECLRLAGGAAHTARELVAGLEVSPGRMRANLDLTGGLIVSERLAAVLAPVLGKAAAKDVISRAARTAAASGLPLAEVLLSEDVIAERFGVRDLERLLDPAGYTGAAEELTARALRHYAPRQSMSDTP